MQTELIWAPSFEVAGALLDQLARSGDISSKKLTAIRALFDSARQIADREPTAASALLQEAAALLGQRGVQGDVRDALLDMATMWEIR